MEKETKDLLERLASRVDLITALLLKSLPKNAEGLSLKEQIAFLDNLGVRPVEMSKIIGRPQNYVSKELVAIRKHK